MIIYKTFDARSYTAQSQRRLDYAFCGSLNHQKVWSGCHFNRWVYWYLVLVTGGNMKIENSYLIAKSLLFVKQIDKITED